VSNQENQIRTFDLIFHLLIIRKLALFRYGF
jgi:hypothetical protein